MGVMTPFKGVRIITRAGQGLLNSEADLDEVLERPDERHGALGLAGGRDLLRRDLALAPGLTAAALGHRQPGAAVILGPGGAGAQGAP